jgi:hypothetical protein
VCPQKAAFGCSLHLWATPGGTYPQSHKPPSKRDTGVLPLLPSSMRYIHNQLKMIQPLINDSCVSPSIRYHLKNGDEGCMEFLLWMAEIERGSGPDCWDQECRWDPAIHQTLPFTLAHARDPRGSCSFSVWLVWHYRHPHAEQQPERLWSLCVSKCVVLCYVCLVNLLCSVSVFPHVWRATLCQLLLLC